MGLNIFWHTAYLAVSLLFTTAVDDVLSLKNLFVTNMSHSESYLKQLSKFGFNQTPDRLLIDSWLTTSKIFLEMTADFNLESCPNQLSNFGYHGTPDWLSTDYRQTHIKPNNRF